jgi:DNA-binding response OmpR family regulator
MQNLHKSGGNRVLDGARLLIVEDDFLLLMDLEAVLRDAGAETVHACRTIDEALAAVDMGDFAAAVLDVRIDRDSIAPVARKLAARRTAIVFYTGQVDNERLMAEWPQCRILSKPTAPHVIVNAIAELLKIERQ